MNEEKEDSDCYYNILNIAKNADIAAIENGYRKLGNNNQKNKELKIKTNL